MITSGTVDAIRNETGNIGYAYFLPMDNEETVLLIDSWEDQESIDIHHQSPMMKTIMELRDEYDLHMKVERYRSEDTIPDSDHKYVKIKQPPSCRFNTEHGRRPRSRPPAFARTEPHLKALSRKGSVAPLFPETRHPVRNPRYPRAQCPVKGTRDRSRFVCP